MARAIVSDLVDAGTFSQITLADLDLDRARALANLLEARQVEAMKLDVRDSQALGQALKDHDVAINATWYKLNPHVMTQAIKVGTPYVDLGGLYHVTLEQLKMDREAKDRGVLCIIGMGSTPGTLNLMSAHAASQVDSTEDVLLASASKVVKQGEGFQVPYSLATMLDEATLPAVVYEEGVFREVPPLSEAVPLRLPEPLGQVDGYLTLHSELATLPGYIGGRLKRLRFALHLPSVYLTYLRTLVEMGLASREPMETAVGPLVPMEAVASVLSRQRPAQEEMDIDMQLVELRGRRGEESITVREWATSWPQERWGIPGGTWGTGVPAAIAADMLVKGKIRGEGVLPPERALEPPPFFDELKARGIEISMEVTTLRALN